MPTIMPVYCECLTAPAAAAAEGGSADIRRLLLKPPI
jgi:hypothetical protein